ncbi:hypothetical protein [Pseudoalteromonas sp. 1_2015MBL_MicDiv]|uniref:hypothetical protein n=1 Tax=Pseudoalteromonas sp. 1_2015MBL_MicDiv TaxID=1720343 RepID=UPI000BBE85B7|nr:hypothetical protein [Pseudoalteromonas sp. 1_2015MBL_MicDiv]ATG77176.1 hypothetical protein AOR04_06340 [Pseudoalteromonas sp. 1_2015MBL_MicDiv]
MSKQLTTPNNQASDLNKFVETAKLMDEHLRSLKLKSATFETGTTFDIDPSTNTSRIVSNGAVIEFAEHTTSVTIRNRESSVEAASKSLQSRKFMTQRQLGSFAGKSQPWASDKLNNKS